MKTIGWCVCFLLIHACGISQSRISKLDSLMLHVYNTNQFVGSVLVIESDSTVYKRSFGWADYSKKDTLTTSSPINLASLSKHFTGTAVMLLIQDGKLSVKDKITQYLPELPYNNITIENLLYHTSGLKDYESITAVFNRNCALVINEDLVKLYAKKGKKLKFSPGEKYKYSNTGYVLLASIVERVSGQSFSDFVQERIFTPSLFEDTYVYDCNNLAEYDQVVWSYTPKYKRADQTRSGKHFSYYDALSGDGAICISINDMEKWAKVLNNKGIVNDSLFQQSITSGRLNNGEPINYGYGWDLIDNNYGHTGGWHNFNTYYFKDTKNDRVVSVLMTNDPKNYNEIIWAIRDVLDEIKKPFPLPVSAQKRGQKLFESKYIIAYKRDY